MRRAPILAVLLAATSASCQLVYGLGDFHPADTSSSSGGGSNEGGHSSQQQGGGGSTGDGGPNGGAPGCGSAKDVACLAPPMGFGTKYFHLVQGPPAEAPSACESGAAPQRFYQMPIAACTDCSCDGVPNPPCSSPEIDSFIMSNCPSNQANSIDKASGNCKAALGTAVKAAAPTPLACGTKGGARTTDDWQTEITLCEVATTTDGCSSGDACVPTGEPICMFQAGALADCPNGWGAPIAVFTDAADNLKCGACSCMPNFTCNGRYLAYQGGTNACFTNGAAITPDTCTPASYVAYDDSPPTGDMSCSANSDASTGDFSPTGPTTICCKSP